MTSRQKLRAILLADRAESQRIHAQREAFKIATTKEERAEMGELTKIRCTLDGDPNIEFMN